MTKLKHKYFFRAVIALLVIVACSWKLWLPGWTITRLAELASERRLGLETSMVLFENQAGGYSISGLKIFNDQELPGTLLLDCNYIFLTPNDTQGSDIAFQNIQCCNGDVYIFMLPEGRTNLDKINFNIPRHVQFSNLRIHFTTPANIKEQELIVVLDGEVSFNNDGTLANTDLKVTDATGSLLSQITKAEKDLQIEGLTLANMMKNKNAAKILFYYPAYSSLQNRFTTKVPSQTQP